MPTLSTAQLRCARELADRPRAVLYAPPGAGKTATVIYACEKLIRGRTLVVAPTRVCSVWRDEILLWSDLHYWSVAQKPPADIERAVKDPGTAVVILTYGQLPALRRRFTNDELTALGFHTLVIDEVGYCKAPGSKRTRHLRKLQAAFACVYGLTGTPASDNYMGLYGIAVAVDGGETLGSAVDRFKQSYFLPQERWEKGLPDINPDKESDLLTKFAELCVQLPDYRETLPELHIEHVLFQLPEETETMYKNLARDYVVDYPGGVAEAANSGVLVGKLQQVASGVLYNDGAFVEFDDSRISCATELLDTLCVRVEKREIKPAILCVYTLRANETRIVDTFDGDLPIVRPSRTKNWLDQVKAHAKACTPHLVLAHARSIGHGINLQHVCNTIVWLEPPWSRDLFDQMNARTWRQGQKDPVNVYIVKGTRTIDAAILDRLEHKEGYEQRLRNHINWLARSGS